ESYLGGYATLGDSCLPPFWSDWYNTSVKQYHYDLELAKAELESAGFTGIGTQLMMPDGEPVPALVLLTPPYDYDPMCIKAAENVANNLRDLGMDVVAKPVDPDTLWQKMNAYDYDMSINCMVWGLSSDPVGNVFDMFAPMASLNHYGWWPVDHEYENPWYNMFGGISTRADNTSQALAIEFHELGILAKESLDREEQIHYTKEAQGVFSEAVPCNILAYPIYNYAIYTGWPGWRGYVVHLGELLNIYSLGALHRGVGPPEIDELNMFLNVPDKIPLGTTVPASVVVFDDRGRPIGDVDVSVSGAGVDLEGTGSGTTDVEGTFRFSVKGTGEGYTTITAHVDHDGNGDEKNRSIT
ncbi:MAG: hypothetical protein KAQ96_04640, partial [Thermoplasmata archaeon]|nr:hypothetical protein [Thermoplasmata archaeon]